MKDKQQSQSPASRGAAGESSGARRRRPKRRTIMVLGYALVLFVGVALGYVLHGGDEVGPSEATTAGAAEATLWTCSMHPQIKLPEPGKCPICYMDLIPLEEDGDADDHPRRLKMSEASAALAEIETTPVERKFVTHTVRMVGKVAYDETRLVESTAWVPGRLDRLFVDYTGTAVRKGDHLFEIYSPDLVVAQDELLLGWRAYRQSTERTREQALRNLRSSEEKLRRWGLLDEQIEQIRQRGKASDQITIYAPVGGIVIEKHRKEGSYVEEGAAVYTIADLSLVWVFLDAYESDLSWLRYGQEVDFTTESYPGRTFKGRVAFIDPVLDEKTRTVKVRVNVPNPERLLKPGMFVRATVRSRLAAGGQVLEPELAGKWICPMHPEVIKDAPADKGTPPTCDECGMDLVPAAELGFTAPRQEDSQPPLVIPATAPLVTGKRAVVYVQVPKTEQPTFEGREVVLGQRAGDHYIVVAGLVEGDRVVTRGNFKIDSALEIRAQPSMMHASGSEEEPVMELAVSRSFRDALGPLYQSYLEASRALAADDLSATLGAIEILRGALDQAEAEAHSLEDNAHKQWEALRLRMAKTLGPLLDQRELSGARKHFRKLSDAAIVLIERFGHPLDEPVYHVFCPMAFEDQGAYWLQKGDDVANPYFGAEMLQCGALEETFAPADDHTQHKEAADNTSHKEDQP